jgi:hypothetical protein
MYNYLYIYNNKKSWRRIVFDTALIVAEEFVIFPFSLFNALSICRLGYF